MDASLDGVVDRTASDRNGSRLCLAVLSVGLGLCAVYALTPASWVAFRQIFIYLSTDAIAVASVAAGVLLYRPKAPRAWLFIGAGLLALTIGDAILGGYSLTDRRLFPSPADAFYVASYPLLAAGLVIAVRRRRPYGVDVRATIDTAGLTVALTYLSWVYIVGPVVHDDALSAFDKLVTLLYPLGDLLLFSVAARFVMGSSWNKRALQLLVVGLALLFVGDSMFALGVSEHSRTTGIWDTVLLAAAVFIGVAALDPTMRALTEEKGDPAELVDRRRFPLIAGVAVVPPAILAIQALRGEPLHVAANVIASLLLVGLLAMRGWFTTSNALQSAQREAMLSRFTSEILSAAGEREELFAATRRALDAFALAEGSEASLVIGSDLELAGIDAAFVAPVMLKGECVAVVVADARPSRLRRWRAALSTIASQLSIALERERLLATEHEAAASLGEQNARLLELDTLKDRFVSSVSHELRTPLTSMVGYLEILRDGEAGELNPEQAHMFEIIDRNCRRLNNLIGDILVTSRFDSGRMQLHLLEVEIADLVASEVQSIAAVAASQGVTITSEVDPGPHHVIADPVLVSQLLANLLSNAVKFTPRDGRVTVTVREQAAFVVLEVADTGVGIPADEVDKIFERFYRASTAVAIGGTGLGLSIVKAIAEAHGGSIGVTSEPGVGTCFRVDLPHSGPHEHTPRPRPDHVLPDEVST